MQNLFPRLLELPLFQGIAYSDFLEIADRVRMSHIKRKKGVILAKEGELCQSLFFLAQGTVSSSRKSDDYSYTLIEEVSAPAVLQPEVLFGLRTRYTRTFTACEAVALFEIDKATVRDILMLYPTFRINYTNILGAGLQLRDAKLWKVEQHDLELKFRDFMLRRVERPAGRKRLLITMDELARQLCATRLKISRMLSALENQGLIELHRGNIIFPCFENFCQASNGLSK